MPRPMKDVAVPLNLDIWSEYPMAEFQEMLRTAAGDLHEIRIGMRDDCGECGRGEFMIYGTREMTEAEFEQDRLRKQRAAEQALERKRMKEEHERAEYERLKEKYETPVQAG